MDKGRRVAERLRSSVRPPCRPRLSRRGRRAQPRPRGDPTTRSCCLARSPWLDAERQRPSATPRSPFSGRGRRTRRRSLHAGRRPNWSSAAASNSSRSIAWGSRAGRESCDGAVDRGAAGFATLQADVIAAMAEAGQRSSRGMGQPPRGGDQLFQPGALIALEQFDHARDLRVLAGRRRCWCGRCAQGRRHICCGLRFRRILVHIRGNGRAGYGLRFALIGRDGLQSALHHGQLSQMDTLHGHRPVGWPDTFLLDRVTA